MSDADRIASLEAEVAAKSEQLQLLHEGLVSAEAEVAALRKDGERRRLTFTAPQAQALLEMFGGEAGEITVGEFNSAATTPRPRA